ncbi:MAG: DUF3293 domain-containing protein [Burkholderiaceae bacterium]
MQTPSVIDPETIQAYRETDYRVYGPAPFTLRVDQPSQALATAHRTHGVTCSAFVTACNPLGQRAEAEDNATRQTALAAQLRARGLDFTPGVGQHPSGDWPGEDSFLIFGLTLEDARTLGRQLDQNAVLWSGAGAVPQLILLR